MVLDSLIAGLLNNYLSKYIKDLDGKNLDIGLLSGTVELTDLQLKPEILAEFDLPLEVKASHIGRIFADLSWTGLFSNPVVVEVEDVFILVTPLADQPYNEEKEKQFELAKKRVLLESIEAKKASPSTEPADLSFTERLTATIVNNIQVNVNRIHIRYEDSLSNPGETIAAGIILEGLSAETTNESWEKTQLDASATIMRKLLQIRNISAYINPAVEQRVKSYTKSNVWRELMKDSIISQKINGEKLDFVLHPSTTETRFTFDKKVAEHYKTPEILLDIITKLVGVSLSRQQYLGVVDIMESIQFMTINERYRKYKPNVPVSGNAKIWWKYAYTAIVEEHIRPWSPERIEYHHSLYVDYWGKYQRMLEVKERGDDIPNTLQKDLQSLEEKLDVTTITIAREKAKRQFIKGAPERIAKRKEEERANRSWFSRLFWGDEEEEEELEDVDESERTDDIWSLLPEDEKDRIYEAIGYNPYESTHTESIPVQYIKEKISFELHQLNLSLFRHGTTLLSSELDNVNVGLQRRPVNNAIMVMFSTEALHVEGVSMNANPTTIMTSRGVPSTQTGQPVFTADFETSPLTIKADSALAVTTEPIDVFYHERTVSELMTFFKIPNLNVEGLKSTTLTSFQRLAKVSSDSLISAINNHNTIQLDIDINSPKLIIPEHGSVDVDGQLLILDLGSLRVNSDLQRDELSLQDATPTEIEDHLYDKFVVRLDDIKAVFAREGDGWREAMAQNNPQNILIPNLGMQINVFISAKPDYKALPQQKIEAVLPSLKFSISDSKLEKIVGFATNLPLPSPAAESHQGPPRGQLLSKVPEKSSYAKMQALKRAKRAAAVKKTVPNYSLASKKTTNVDQIDSGALPSNDEDVYYTASDHSDETIEEWAKSSPVPSFEDNDSSSNQTSMLLRFLVREIVLTLALKDHSLLPPLVLSPEEDTDSTSGESSSEYLTFRVDSVCVDAAVSGYGLAVQLGLRGIQVIDKFHIGPDGTYLHLLSSPTKSELISVLYRKVEKKCPDFSSYYSSMEQAAVVKFTALNATFHRTAFLFLKRTAETLYKRFQTLIPVSTASSEPPTSTASSTLPVPSKSAAFPSAIERGIIKFYAQVHLEFLCISLCDLYENHAKIYFRGLDASVTDKLTRTTIKTRLKDFTIEDPVESVLYRKILCLRDQTAFDLKFTAFKFPANPSATVSSEGTSRPIPLDYSIRLRGGSVQAVILGPFLKNMQNFFAPFVDQATIDSAADVSTKVVQKQVDDIQSQKIRIKLDVQIRAPIVFLPQNSHSPHCLVANLGDFIVTSDLEEQVIIIPQHPKETVLVLSLTVQIVDAQVLRGIVVENQVLGPHCQIMEPLSFELLARHAVNKNSARLIPTTVEGTLDEIKINLNEQDLITTLSTLRGNLMAPASSAAYTGNVPEVDGETEPSEDVVTATDVLSTPSVAESEQDGDEDYSTIQVEFEMKGIEVALYTNEPRLKGKAELILRDPKFGLSSLSLGQVSVSATMNKKGSITAAMSLQEVLLQDIRPNSPLAIKKLLLKSRRRLSSIDSRRSTPDSDQVMSPMIEVAYIRDEEGNQQVDFTIDEVRVNIFVHYLLAVYNFLSSALTQSISETPLSPVGELPTREVVRSASANVTSLSEQAAVKPAPSSTSFWVRGHLRRPEVVLFDDPTNKDTQVLVLKMEGNLTYHTHMEEENLVGNLSQIEVFSCMYSQPLRTAYQVLEPCAITLTRSVASGIPETIGVDFGEVCVHVSPRVVYVMTGVMSALASLTQKPPNMRPMMDDYGQEDLWTPKPIFSHGFNRRKGSMRNMVDFAPLPDPSPEPTQRLTAEVPRLRIILELEVNRDHLSLLTLQTGMRAKVYDWSACMRAEGEMTLEAMVYNENISVWEPLIEPVLVSEDNYRPWELLLKLTKSESHPIFCTSQIDSLPIGPRDSVDGHLGGRSLESYPVTETETDSESASDTELEWDGHYSSSLLSSDLTPPQDEDKPPPQESTKSEEEEEDSDSENDGFFGKVKGFFQDIFSSESDSEAEEEQKKLALIKKSESASDMPRSDSGIDSSLRLTSSTLASNEDKDEIDGDDDLPDSESIATYIIINSMDKLDLSVTPSSIDVIHNLLSVFSSKPSTEQAVPKEDVADITIISTLGIPAKLVAGVANEDNIQCQGLVLESTPIGPIDQPDNARIGRDYCPLGESDSLEALKNATRKSKYANTLPGKSSDETDHGAPDPTETIIEDAKLELEGFHTLENFLPCKAGLSLLPIKPSFAQVFNGSFKYALIREVLTARGRETLKLRSPLQVKNNCQIPLNIGFKQLDLQAVQGPAIPSEDHEEFTMIGTVLPGTIIDIPMLVAYHAGLYAWPMDRGLNPNEKPIKWTELAEPAEITYTCKPIIEGATVPFYYRVTRQPVQVEKPTSLQAAPCYILNIHPPVTLHNFLPYDLVYSFQDIGLKFLLKGEKMDVHSININQGQNMNIQVKNYLSDNWEGHLNVSREMKSTEVINMERKSKSEDQKHFSLWANSTSTAGAWDIFLYSPYWFVNKSELPVEIRASRSRKVYSTHSLADPVLFCFLSAKRRKAKLRVFDSVWSTSFSLDTVGSSGVVICKDEDHDRTYQFWMDIRLSNLSLTKIITLMPYFLIKNQTDMTLSYVEQGVKAGVWVNIKPNEVLPFWPGGKSMKLMARKSTTPDILTSRPFCIDMPNTTILRMERGSALTVNVEGGVQGPTTIGLSPYLYGQAPVRLDNLCDDVNLRFNQKNVGGRLLLRPHQSLLYTWDDPTAERTLTWNIYNRNKKSFDCLINRDGWGKLSVSVESINRSMLPGDGLYVEGDDASVYSTDDETERTETDGSIDHPLMAKKERTSLFWVSYMDGLQRVFMITQSSRIARLATQSNISELATMELFVSFHGIGLSLINALYEEVAYISLFSSPSRWEVETKPDKWKALTVELSGLLEDKWKHGEENVIIESAPVEANLKENTITKPVAGPLRRVYNPGLWVHLRQSEHFMGVHFKLWKVQVDNQLFDAYFPTVINVNALPADVLRKTGPKPFVELSMLKKTLPESGMDTVKYFKVLVQESSVRLDDGFLRSILDIFSNLRVETEEIASLNADLDFINRSLRESSTAENMSVPVMYEYLHLSPLKFVISFSLAGEPHLVDDKPMSDLLKFFMDSIGSTLPEVSEVELKLAYFEKRNTLLTRDQLLADVQDHYVSQGVKQAYVFVLGLDVLGNPYGLFRDVNEGISDFFYEPYLGLIQGPGEFAEGLAKGVQSLLGHTVGGVADTFGGLAGMVGRSLSFLTFDEDYQRARVRRIQRHPDNLPKHLLYAGQGFVMGVIAGLSGVVTSPLYGAHEEGLKGFFKGVGRGILGLVTKPFGGVFDGITLVFEGIERATDSGEMPTMRVRIPRFISQPQGMNIQGLQPYSPYKALGNLILHNIRRKDFYETDIYFAHATISSDSTPDVVLVTDRHILVVEKCRWWGGWDLDQGDGFEKFSGPPILDSNKIIYAVREGSKQITREIDCGDQELCKWLFKKLKFALDQYNHKDSEEND